MIRTSKDNFTLRLFNTHGEAFKHAVLCRRVVEGLRLYEGGWAYREASDWFDENGIIPAGVFSHRLDEREIYSYCRDLASYLHRNQKYGEEPYDVHLGEVEAVVVQYGFGTPILRAAARLHDAGEDQGADSVFLRLCGVPEDVIEPVEAVTDEVGATRKERKAKTLPKTAKSVGGKKLKLADRIANVRRGGKLAMYAQEHSEFRGALYDGDPVLEPLWNELETLLGIPTKQRTTGNSGHGSPDI